MKSEDLEIGDCFHFAENGALHMVTENNNIYVEYKQYSNGHSRIFYHPKDIVKASDYNEKLYEVKWFSPQCKDCCGFLNVQERCFGDLCERCLKNECKDCGNRLSVHERCFGDVCEKCLKHIEN